GGKRAPVETAGLRGLGGFARLDNLPREVHAQIDAQRTALTAARNQLAAAKNEVAQNLANDPALFRALPSAALYNDRLSRSADVLAGASRDTDQLVKLEKANRRQDTEEAKRLLTHERQNREAAIADAEAVRKDAAHWVELKKHLPEEVREMERDYNTLHAYDLAPLTAAVQKAQTDWPEKKADLQVRLDNVREIANRAEQ